MQQLAGALDFGQNELDQAASRGDQAAVSSILQELESAKADYDALQPTYEGAIKERQGELLDGLNKGTLAGFKAKKSYSTGSLGGMPAYGAPVIESETIEFDAKEGHKQLSNTLSELMGVEPYRVNTTKGLTPEEMVVVASAQSPEAKADAIAGLYQNAYPVNVRNQQNFIVETSDGNYMLAYPPDKQGQRAAAAIASEAFPVTFGVLTAMMPMPKALNGMTKTKMATSSATSNLGYQVAKAAQEYVMTAASPKPVRNRMVDNIGEAAKEAALMTGVEIVATPILGRVVKGMSSQVVNQVDQSLLEAAKVMDKSNFPMSAPVGASMGDAGLLYARKLAADFQDSAVGLQHLKERRVLRDFQETMQGKTPNLPSKRQELYQGLKQQWDSITESIGRKDARIKSALQGAGERRFDALAADGANQGKLGQDIQTLVDTSKDQAQKIADAAFEGPDGLYAKTDAAGIAFTPQEVSGVIKSVLQSNRNRFLGSTGIDEVLAELATTQQPLGYQSLRNITMRARDSGSAAAVGGKTSPQVAGAVERALREFGESKVASAGLSDDLAKTMQIYDESKLAFNRSSPGAILAEKLGDYKKSGSDVVSLVLKDEKTAGDILDALYKSGDVQTASGLHKQMQDAYLEKIGLYDRFGKSARQVEPKKSMIEALWGRNPDGTPNPLAAERVDKSIREMNAAFEAAKVPIADLTPQNMDRLLSPLSDKERRSILSEMAQKSKLVQEQQRLVDNEMITLAKKGAWDKVDNDEFADALFRARPDDVTVVMRNLPLKQRATVQKDFLYHFFERYGTGGNATNQIDGFDLWNGDAFIQDINNWSRGKGRAPQIIKNMDAVLGRKSTDQIVAASRMNRAYRPIAESESDAIRTMMSETGIKVYASNLPSRIRRRIQAAAYGSNEFNSLLRDLSARKDPSSIKASTDKVMAWMTGTRMGWNSLASTTRNDPDAQLAIHEMLGTLAAEKASQPTE